MSKSYKNYAAILVYLRELENNLTKAIHKHISTMLENVKDFCYRFKLEKLLLKSNAKFQALI